MGRKKEILHLEKPAEVGIGNTVSIRFNTGSTLRLTIKSPRETNPDLGIVSYESPIGRALLGAKVDEIVYYQAGDNSFVVKILEIA